MLNRNQLYRKAIDNLIKQAQLPEAELERQPAAGKGKTVTQALVDSILNTAGYTAAAIQDRAQALYNYLNGVMTPLPGLTEEQYLRFLDEQARQAARELGRGVTERFEEPVGKTQATTAAVPETAPLTAAVPETAPLPWHRRMLSTALPVVTSPWAYIPAAGGALGAAGGAALGLYKGQDRKKILKKAIIGLLLGAGVAAGGYAGYQYGLPYVRGLWGKIT